MKRCFYLLGIALAVFSGCAGNVTKDEIMANEHIPTKVKQEMDAMSKQVYAYLRDDYYGPLSQLFSDSLTATIKPEFHDKFIPQIKNLLKDKPYRSYGEYYIRHKKPMEEAKLTAGAGDSAYTFSIVVPATETFVAMLIAGDSLNEIMLTLIYEKTGQKWKISSILGEDFSLAGKTAPQLYRSARLMAQDNDLTDAMNTLGLARHCLFPAAGHFSYSVTASMHAFSDSLDSVIKIMYPLPYAVKGVATAPKIFNTHYEPVNHRFVPMVMYISTVNVKDTVALKKENDEVHAHIGETLTGMDKHNTRIVYRAYNVMPNGRNDPAYYGFIREF